MSGVCQSPLFPRGPRVNQQIVPNRIFNEFSRRFEFRLVIYSDLIFLDFLEVRGLAFSCFSRTLRAAWIIPAGAFTLLRGHADVIIIENRCSVHTERSFQDPVTRITSVRASHQSLTAVLK